MQDLSFKQVNQEFVFRGYTFSVAIYTFRNVYTLSPECTDITIKDGLLTAECNGLLWAGGQEKVEGHCSLQAIGTDRGIRVKINAKMSCSVEVIRRVKLTVRNMPRGRIINSIDVCRNAIPDSGLVINYPEGWRECGTPLIIMREGENHCFFRSLDNIVREKAFIFVPEDQEHTSVELIHEELAVNFSSSIQVPEWEIGCCEKPEDIYKEHIAYIEKAYKLKKWEDRTDVPEWFRNISLVAAIHGQHWTGHIFNDYASMLQVTRRLASMMDPTQLLIYLPGWEGRYYWQYGDYRPDERMGGEKRFRELLEGAHELGVHVMPMFGMNVVGVHLEDYQRWGATSRVTRASGGRGAGSVDWDGSRHYDHASNASVHPGAPQWLNRFCDQIAELTDRYHFDAIFLDIMARWTNDPNLDYYEGVRKMVDRIHSDHPELLISGEGWYDALMALCPLLQSGHTDGKMHYHDTAYPGIFDPYVREFAHLCLGDPAFLSTGVHEQGRNAEWKAPLTKGIIPTITIVDGTLDAAPERVAEIIRDAKAYHERYC